MEGRTRGTPNLHSRETEPWDGSGALGAHAHLGAARVLSPSCVKLAQTRAEQTVGSSPTVTSQFPVTPQSEHASLLLLAGSLSDPGLHLAGQAQAQVCGRGVLLARAGQGRKQWEGEVRVCSWGSWGLPQRQGGARKPSSLPGPGEVGLLQGAGLRAHSGPGAWWGLCLAWESAAMQMV